MRVLLRILWRAAAIALMAVALGWVIGVLLLTIVGWEPVSWKV